MFVHILKNCENIVKEIERIYERIKRTLPNLNRGPDKASAEHVRY